MYSKFGSVFISNASAYLLDTLFNEPNELNMVHLRSSDYQIIIISHLQILFDHIQVSIKCNLSQSYIYLISDNLMQL